MKQEIIERMRSLVSEKSSCKSDFEKYDVPALKDSSEPFFWMVREYSTSLLFIGPDAINKIYSNETWRMDLFRDKTILISSFLYYKNDKTAKFFFWNGTVLLQISPAQLEEAYCNIIEKSYKELCRDFKKEFDICCKPLEVRFASKETEKHWNDTIKFAESLNDPSLVQCLEKLTKWKRIAVDQYIMISLDYCDHCFSFAEMVNGSYHINGGIIFHDEKKENHWQTHT